MRNTSAHLDRDFVTIYFLQGNPEKHAIAVRRIYLVRGLIFFVFTAVFLRVWQEMRIVNLGYQVNQSRQTYRKLTDEQRQLLSRRNALASLERVEQVAKNGLGLRRPQGDQLVFLPEPEDGALPPTGWWSGWLQKALHL